MANNGTTIRVTKELRDFLATQAIKKNESFDQIIRRLIEKLWGVKVGEEAKTE